MSSHDAIDWQALRTGIFAALAGVIVIAASSYINSLYKPKQQELPEKILTLTKSLNSAAETIGQIEDEIKQRQKLVQTLERDAETASKLSALNKDQLDAVAQVLRSEIKSEERQSFWSAQLLALFYAALGVALSEGYRFILRQIAKRRLQSVA